jgi:hypothetical protein
MNLLQTKSTTTTTRIDLPQKATNVVEWRKSFDMHTRQHLAKKMVEIILGGLSSTSSLTITSTLSPKRYTDFSSYLIKITMYIENQMYKQAKDQEEYFYLLAERIYNLGRVFNSGRRKRKTKNSDAKNHKRHNHIVNKPAENKYSNCNQREIESSTNKGLRC